MIIEKLQINNFRNFCHLELSPTENINLIYGQNGSGKTSLLEAIYYLGVGRSFRTHRNNWVIRNQQDRFSLFAELNQTSIGMERDRDGKFRFKVSDQQVESIAKLAEVLPLQLINPDAYRLLEDGPKFRRDFIHWGLFYTEPMFFHQWKQLSRALKQRNIALRQRHSKNEITLWNKVFIIAAEHVAEMAEAYLKEFKFYFLKLIHQLLPDFDSIEIDYLRGWAKEKSLETVLDQALESDYNLGYTQFGPHRSNLVININRVPAKDYLSRGQQKLFVYAMRLAQGQLLQKQGEEKCALYLIDDLPAELDQTKREALFSILVELRGQIFITGIDISLLSSLATLETSRMFHVKHGNLI